MFFVLFSQEIEVMFFCINQTNVTIKNIIGQNKGLPYSSACVCVKNFRTVWAGCNLVSM